MKGFTGSALEKMLGEISRTLEDMTERKIEEAIQNLLQPKLKVMYLENYPRKIVEMRNEEESLEWGELSKAHDSDACIDIRAAIPEQVTIEPMIEYCINDEGKDTESLFKNKFKKGYSRLIPNGFKCEIDEKYEIQVRPRSGNATKKGLTVINTPGTIDSHYRGEVHTGVINLGDEPITIHPGDRIAQIKVALSTNPRIIKVDSVSDTTRGEGGFGSSGRR